MMSVQPFRHKACDAYTAPRITYRKHLYHITWLTAPTTQNTVEDDTQIHHWIAEVSEQVSSVLQKCYNLKSDTVPNAIRQLFQMLLSSYAGVAAKS